MTSTPDEMRNLVQSEVAAAHEKQRLDRRERLRTFAIVAGPLLTLVLVVLALLTYMALH